MFIQTEPTPNPATLKFLPGQAVLPGDTAEFVSAEEAAGYIRLVMLVNDVSLRGLIPAELAKGFGFFTKCVKGQVCPLSGK